jgi:hypothetical protein
MKLKVGRIVKVTPYIEDNGEYAVITQLQGETTVIHYIKTQAEQAIENSHLEVQKWQTINKIFPELQEGQLVITDGDGSCKKSTWIYGEIGEISDDAEGRKLIFVWNNQCKGTRGTKRPSFWKYSWKIKSWNKKAHMIVVDASTREGRKYECFHCEEEFESAELTKAIDGEYYCDDCMPERFCSCEACGEQIDNDDARYGGDDNGPYCQDCYDERYTCCTHCGEEIRADDSREYGGNHYCDSCFSDRYTNCEECEQVIRNDDAIYDEENERYICSDCHSGAGTKVIHDYGYRPDPTMYKCDGDIPLYMGVELEVQSSEFGTYADKFVHFLTAEGKDKYFYLKHDGSIGEGFEIVSQPFTLKYAHKNIGFNKILKWLRDNKLQSEESGKCGLHIHVSRDFFEDLDLTKLRLFFKSNQNKIMELSRRGKQDCDYNYCKFEDFSWQQLLQNPSQDGRYWALNLNSSRETIEFRVFRGTLDSERVLAILQFVDAISHFVKKNGIASFIYGEGKYKANSWELFIDWCKDENKYGSMIKYFTKESICV